MVRKHRKCTVQGTSEASTASKHVKKIFHCNQVCSRAEGDIISHERFNDLLVAGETRKQTLAYHITTSCMM